MALTLAEASKLSNDILQIGVIETIIKDSPVLQLLPFETVLGNGLTYNQENAAATAAFYDVGDTWAESTPTFTQLTAVLKILGGDADIDNFLRVTRSDLQDLETTIVELKAKAVRHKFEETFIAGSVGANPKSFDGIDVLCSSGQTESMGVNGGTLTLDKLDLLIDKVKGGRPDLLLMSKRSHRKLTALARQSTILQTDLNEFGPRVPFYDGIPIGVSDFIPDNQTVGTSTDCSTVYAMQFGTGALAGISSPGGVQVERVGSLETKDASRYRIKWYAAIALFNAVKLGKLTGVRD